MFFSYPELWFPSFLWTQQRRSDCWFCSVLVVICNMSVSHQTVPSQADFGGLLDWFFKHLDFRENIPWPNCFSGDNQCLGRDFSVPVVIQLDRELERILLVCAWWSWQVWSGGEDVFVNCAGTHHHTALLFWVTFQKQVNSYKKRLGTSDLINHGRQSWVLFWKFIRKY